MNYDARKHNPKIVAILNSMGFDHSVTYTDTRTFGRRTSFVPDFWKARHNKVPASFPLAVRAEMLRAVNAYLDLHGITNVEAYMERCHYFTIEYDRFNLRITL